MSRFRRAFFGAIVLVLALVSVELLSRLAFTFGFPSEAPEDVLRATANRSDSTDGEWQGTPVEGLSPGQGRSVRALHQWGEVIHPYLGFVMGPASPGGRALDLETLGFPSGGPFPRERRDDRVVAGIFGGSLAGDFANHGGFERVFSEVQGLPEFQGRELMLLNFAVAGYKQPQALLTLAYLLALGGKLDVVVLIDGFNEVVLPIAENVPLGVFPFFPRSWAYRVADLNLATETRALVGEIAYLARRRADRARALLGSTLRHSRAVWLAWFAWDRRISAQLSERRLELQSEPTRDRLDYLATGPAWFPRSPASLESSLEMQALCERRGIRFYHFLQPNQYVPGSKPMGPEELRVAVTPGHPYSAHVRNAYPLLRESGEELRASGVRFHDLTQIFSTKSPCTWTTAVI